MNRRQFVLNSLALASVAVTDVLRPRSRAFAAGGSADDDRLRVLLLGGLIGDALGGPIEFSDESRLSQWLTDARSWGDDASLTTALLEELAETVPLLGYEQLRPDTAPYGPWRERAPAGTLTDDSRHKIVLMRAVRVAHQEKRSVNKNDLAQQFLDFVPLAGQENSAEILALNEEGFREYRYAARWLLGERDLSKARPVERIWAGVDNCSGQMMLPPLAARYAGQPEAAYKAAYELDFIDAPLARDIAAALVAGLAAALAPELNDKTTEVRWKTLLSAMRDTDPFGYADVPFAGRQLHKWMDKAKELADRANKRPKELYRLLETEGDPVFWWDAHFTLLVPLSMLHLCEFNPLAAMHLTLDFGHDTDSYAQVLGCMIGAVHGVQVFPQKMRDAVTTSLQADFEEDIEQWLKLLEHRVN